MNFAIVSLNNAAYQPLADITWNQNKVIYAEKQGYSYACKIDKFYGVIIGYEKMWFLRDMLSSYPEIDWIWWVGCDTLVTNMTTKLENKVDNNYHFIISSDCNGINADSFLVRNSPEGRAYIELIISKYDQYKDHEWVEQKAIIDTIDDNKDIIKIVPQREINAYEYRLYPECIPKDKFDNDGQWQPGDFLIHWPGTGLAHRIQLAQYFTQLIVQ
jgi:hypothetical protein